MKAHGRTEILIGGVDAMPPAIQAVVEGRMHATVRNSSCRIHGGAIVAGVAAARGPKTGLPIPKQHRHRRPNRHENERARDAVDGRAVPNLTLLPVGSDRGDHHSLPVGSGALLAIIVPPVMIFVIIVQRQQEIIERPLRDALSLGSRGGVREPEVNAETHARIHHILRRC